MAKKKISKKKAANRRTTADDELLAKLGAEPRAKKVDSFSRVEERVIAGFEEIQRFYKEHDRLPESGGDRDIFERMYAIRLERIAGSEDYRKLLAEFDEDGLLSSFENECTESMNEEMTDEELLAALGTKKENASDISNLKHVRDFKEQSEGEERARRIPCADFEKFKEVFEKVQSRFDTGEQETSKYQQSNRYSNDIELGDMFILEGQKAIVAGINLLKREGIKDKRDDARLRVVFDNGTESNLLLRSLQKVLTVDKTSRRILSADALPLFSNDTQTGHIYVLRSLSDDPFITEHREVLHKIGVTTGEVKDRIKNAKKDPTYLLADVEVVAIFTLINLNPQKLEHVLHTFFSGARLKIQLPDRFGIPVEPKEWFVLPIEAITQAIELLQSRQIEHCRYDSEMGQIVDAKTDEPV